MRRRNRRAAIPAPRFPSILILRFALAFGGISGLIAPRPSWSQCTNPVDHYSQNFLINCPNGWTFANVTSTCVGGSSGYLALHPTTSDPQAASPSICFAPSTHDYLRVDIRSFNTDRRVQLFYSNAAHGISASFTKVWTIASDNNWHYYTFPLSGDPSSLGYVTGWDASGSGSVTKIRLDPAMSSNGEIDYSFVFLRRDDKAPYAPVVDNVSEAGTTATLSVHGDDPPPTFDPGVGPDIYGSGVYDFGWSVDAPVGAQQWVGQDSYNEISGTAYGTIHVDLSTLIPGCHTVYVWSRDRCGQVGPATRTTVTVGAVYRISGRSTSYETGLPVVGDVITYGDLCGPTSGQATTDANGYYQTPPLSFGSYSVGAGACADLAHACSFGNPVVIGCAGDQTANFQQKGLSTVSGLSAQGGLDGASIVVTWIAGTTFSPHPHLTAGRGRVRALSSRPPRQLTDPILLSTRSVTHRSLPVFGIPYKWLRSVARTESPHRAGTP